MSLDKKILSEIQRYRSIDKYIAEQAGEDLGALAPEAGAVPPPPPSEATATPPPPPGDVAPTPVDVENDPDVEKIDDDGKSEESTDEESGSEELDITELVTAQKEIQTKQDDYFENLFGQLNMVQVLVLLPFVHILPSFYLVLTQLVQLQSGMILNG